MKSAAPSLETYNQRVKDRAEKLIWEEIPQRVLDLDEMLQRPMFQLHSAENVVEPVETSALPVNSSVKEMLDLVRPKLLDLIETTELLQTWVKLHIPKMEEGNNSGVEVQENVLESIGNINSKMKSALGSISYYYIRAEYLKKVEKYPNIQDYKQNIIHYDIYQACEVRNLLSNMKDHYHMLHQKICKNLEKVKNPKNKDDTGNGDNDTFYS